MDAGAAVDALALLSPLRRKAFVLLVLEHAAAAFEPVDRKRRESMDAERAAAYTRGPRFDALLSRRWRRLTGEPGAAPAPNPAPTISLPSTAGTELGRRFAALADFNALPDPDLDDDALLLGLTTAERDHAAGWVLDAATLALEPLDADDPRPHAFGDALRSVTELYAERGATDALGPHLDASLAFARTFTGDKAAAADERAEARTRGLRVLAPGE
jgi:hypothetical protein